MCFAHFWKVRKNLLHKHQCVGCARPKAEYVDQKFLYDDQKLSYDDQKLLYNLQKLLHDPQKFLLEELSV